MGYLLGMGETFTEALQFTVVLLVASIPIAIEIVCTTTLALGSRQLSEHGAIVTRLAAIEDMAGGWRMGWCSLPARYGPSSPSVNPLCFERVALRRQMGGWSP